MIHKGLAEFLPTSVQKSYFMLSNAERDVLNTALEKYRPGQSEPILVAGREVLKPALRLMTNYRLVIDEIKDGQAITSHTRWVDAVQVREAEVYLTFSPTPNFPNSNSHRARRPVNPEKVLRVFYRPDPER